MNLEKAYCIKLSSLVDRLFCSFGAKRGQERTVSFIPVMNSKLYPLVRLMKLRKLSQVRLAKKRFRPPSIQLALNG